MNDKFEKMFLTKVHSDVTLNECAFFCWYADDCVVAKETAWFILIIIIGGEINANI